MIQLSSRGEMDDYQLSITTGERDNVFMALLVKNSWEAPRLGFPKHDALEAGASVPTHHPR